MKKLKKTNRPNLYDYLKIIALITMLIDHIGFYLFPEYDFLRLIWRIALPIFLFLVWFSWSYSRRRDIPLIGIMLWIFSFYIYKKYWYGTNLANILIWITITRFFLNIINKNNWHRAIIISIIFILIHPTYNKYIDYWSLSFFFGLRWRIARYHRKFFHLWIIVLFWWIIYNIIVFDFWLKNGNYSLCYILCLLYYLFYFSAFILSLNNKEIHTNRKWLDSFILFFSKHTLAFYWIHIVILNVLWLLKFWLL
jgi:hypothetical protein